MNVLRLICLIALGSVLSFSCSTMAADAPAELHTAAEVRSLTPKQASEHIPLKLKGVITYYNAALVSHFLQDETAGIYLVATNLPPLTPGQQVEVNGFTGPGEYAPIVIPSSVKVIGTADLPKPVAVSADELFSGAQDSQFVSVKGIVRSTSFDVETKQYIVEMVMGGERFSVCASQLPVTNELDLVDGELEVHGVCSTLFNLQRQLLGFRLMAPRVEDLVIIQPAASNPFNVPNQSMTSLLQFTPRGNFGHRVKLTGIVTCSEPGDALFIQDGNESVYCQTKLRAQLDVGDKVEVLGFPSKGEYSPMLKDASFHKLGTGATPVAVETEPEEILTGKHDCQLIQIHARLIERPGRGRDQFMILEKNGFIFHAYLRPGNPDKSFTKLQSGSEVLVTGICLIERGNSWHAGEGWRAKSFRVLLRSPADIMVEQAPPFWSAWDINRIISMLTIVILIGVLRILYLQRRIHEVRGS